MTETLKPRTPVDALTHEEATRPNIPSAEMEPLLEDEDRETIRVAYERRDPDLDPQLVWRGKDVSDWSDLVVDAPPVFLQEQVHPKALIEDLRSGRENGADLFSHFGLDDEDLEAEVEFYRHSRKWSNRMILGDSLSVMASLAEREGLKGKVQCIYLDPPYGIRFNSNFQWSTTSRDVKDGKLDHLTREPEQVRAFRDTWADGIHSYLTYLRDRLTVARDLLTESGSIFLQIGDENVHRVRAVMDEVFGEGNFVNQISFDKTSGDTGSFLDKTKDYLLWYARDFSTLKFRMPLRNKSVGGDGATQYRNVEEENGLRRPATATEVANPAYKLRFWAHGDMKSQRPPGSFPVPIFGTDTRPGRGFWKTGQTGMKRLQQAGRLLLIGNTLRYIRYLDDFGVYPYGNHWTDTIISGFGNEKTYVVQTLPKVIERCLLMTTDPGDLVLDPTCGSGTTATVAEQWGRRWITIDTSRVALALARARIMGARYPYYLLKDSREGREKEAALAQTVPADGPDTHDVRQGFVYERVPHVTLKSIANNARIDVLWDEHQPAVEAALAELNDALSGLKAPHPIDTGGRAGQAIDFTASGVVEMPSGEMAPANGFMEWEVPREPGTPWPADHLKLLDKARKRGKTGKMGKPAREALLALNRARGLSLDADALPEDTREPWPAEAVAALERFWEARIARQRAIDDAIAASADYETLYDRPYEDKKRVRVAGPFTVESLSPHRSPAVDEDGEFLHLLEDEADHRVTQEDMDRRAASETRTVRDISEENYLKAIYENLRAAGVQQADKAGHIAFTALEPWEGGQYVTFQGTYEDGSGETKSAGVYVGPEYSTVQRADLVAAARECADAGFDVLIACAFNFDVHAGEFKRLGRVPVLQARMNPDLHMAGDLKAGGGNLFVVFGDPDVQVETRNDGRLQVRVAGLDVFKPQTGEIESTDADDLACWFVDTDYSGESFFVRQAYFPGAESPYKALRTTLKAEIDEEAWDSLKRTVSRPFVRPESGRIAVKVINHLGDEAMKVLRV